MIYTLSEIVKYHAWDSLDSKQESELLNIIESYNDLVDSIKCSDVPTGFISEDEAHEPLNALNNYKYELLNGNKKERQDAMRLLISELSSIALSSVRSAECGMEEWNKIYKVVK